MRRLEIWLDTKMAHVHARSAIILNSPDSDQRIQGFFTLKIYFPTEQRAFIPNKLQFATGGQRNSSFLPILNFSSTNLSAPNQLWVCFRALHLFPVSRSKVGMHKARIFTIVSLIGNNARNYPLFMPSPKKRGGWKRGKLEVGKKEEEKAEWNEIRKWSMCEVGQRFVSDGL